jgi:hypothetical protein
MFRLKVSCILSARTGTCSPSRLHSDNAHCNSRPPSLPCICKADVRIYLLALPSYSASSLIVDLHLISRDIERQLQVVSDANGACFSSLALMLYSRASTLNAPRVRNVFPVKVTFSGVTM